MIGCIINLCGSVIINIGTNLIKYHHTQQDPSTVRTTPFFSSTLAPATPSPPTRSSSLEDTQQLPAKHHHIFPPVSPHSASSSPASAPPSPRSPRTPIASTFPHSPPLTPVPRLLPLLPSPPPVRSVYWYLGFTLFFVGNVSNFISMGFTAQSLLAGLGSIQFITNVLCSALILKHPVTTRVLWATFAIVVGNVLIVAFASHHSDQLTVDQLWDLYTDNPSYQVYCVVLVVLVLILYVYYKGAPVAPPDMASAVPTATPSCTFAHPL